MQTAELIYQGLIALATVAGSVASTLAVCKVQLHEHSRRLGVVEKYYVTRRELELTVKNLEEKAAATEKWAQRAYRMTRRLVKQQQTPA